MRKRMRTAAKALSAEDMEKTEMQLSDETSLPPSLEEDPDSASAPSDAQTDAERLLMQRVWNQLHAEAEEFLRKGNPFLQHFMREAILNQTHLEEAVIWRLAERLDHSTFPALPLIATFRRLLQEARFLEKIFTYDLVAIHERDPVCNRYLEPILYFKGFHALQTHRFAHLLWRKGAEDLALYLQARASEIFQVDIHPAVPIGKGVFIDHGTGIVIGATAVIEDDVSLLQGVTLGGTGKEEGDRHPKIRRGVLVGAGAKILGNLEIGPGARVAAGSVVLSSVAAHTTVAGVPARLVSRRSSQDLEKTPALTMDQLIKEENRREGKSPSPGGNGE